MDTCGPQVEEHGEYSPCSSFASDVMQAELAAKRSEYRLYRMSVGNGVWEHTSPDYIDDTDEKNK